MTEHPRTPDYEHRGIDYDAYVPPAEPASDRKVWLAIVGILALAGLLMLANRAQAQEQPHATVYVNGCDSAGKCKTVAIPVPACNAGGQAQLAQFFADKGITIRAFKCVEGDEA